MGSFFDNVARTLATPMPRRKAFRLLGGALLGGLFAPYALAAACTTNGNCNTNQCCLAGQCAGKSSNVQCTSICCAPGTCCFSGTACGVICGSSCCGAGQCCKNGACQSSTGGNGGPCP